MNYETLHDAELWTMIASDDRGAFGYAFKVYSKDLFKYGQKFTGSREVIEDVIQDVYLDLWNKRKTTHIKSSLKFYLFTAFRREVIRRLSSFRQQESIEQFSSAILLESSYLEAVVKKQNLDESTEKLHKAIRLLSERQREAIYLRYFVELKYEEIAELMNVQIPSLYNLIFKSIRILKESLTEKVQYKTK